MGVVASLEFPLDGLVRCGVCQSEMNLRQQPDTHYTCINGCGVPRPGTTELNTLILGTIAAHLSTEGALPLLRQAVSQALREEIAAGTCSSETTNPTDAELRTIATDTDTFRCKENLPTVAITGEHSRSLRGRGLLTETAGGLCPTVSFSNSPMQPSGYSYIYFRSIELPSKNGAHNGQ